MKSIYFHIQIAKVYLLNSRAIMLSTNCTAQRPHWSAYVSMALGSIIDPQKSWFMPARRELFESHLITAETLPKIAPSDRLTLAQSPNTFGSHDNLKFRMSFLRLHIKAVPPKCVIIIINCSHIPRRARMLMFICCSTRNRAIAVSSRATCSHGAERQYTKSQRLAQEWPGNGLV